MTILLDAPRTIPAPTAPRMSPRVLVEAAMLGPDPAVRTARTHVGADLLDALDQPITRELLISRCADEPGAHRVLGVALALGRASQTPEQHRVAYTVAAYAALALARRELGIGLLDTALEADDVLDDEDPFAISLCLAIYRCEARPAHYGYFAARLALRLRHA
ncbi:MAG TPA: hypothetical protein VL551_27665 [Actinospica sp.]|jgi:hypothetical protein|nr:hypothetical protein [Actinospica sp.]